MTDNFILKADGIYKKYSNKTILSGASFTAEKGDCIGIVGANGCGKSTLLKIISGAIKANRGCIYLNNQSTSCRSSAITEFTGYVPQDNPLFEDLTVYDNLRLWYSESKRSLKVDLESGIIKEFGLTDYKNYTVNKLSGGTKKRLSIICALAKEPQLLILDEPGASLDIVCKEDIKTYIRKFIDQGHTVVIASHEEGELSVCNKMYMLNEGVLRQIPVIRNGHDLIERMTSSHA